MFANIDPSISKDVEIVKLFCTTQRVQYGRKISIDFRDPNCGYAHSMFFPIPIVRINRPMTEAT